MAGEILLDADGNRMLDADGNVRLTDANDDCPPCCASPHTCHECGACCFSDQSTARVSFANFAADPNESCLPMDCVLSGSVDLAWVGITDGLARWTLTVGNEIFNVYYLCDGDFWLFDWLPDFNDCSNGTVINTQVQFFVGSGTCCGASAEGAEGQYGEFGECLMSADITVLLLNNKCCKCDVDATPTCIASTKDYCPDDGDGACDQFTGNEAACDEALP